MTGGILASVYNWSEPPAFFLLPSPAVGFGYGLDQNFKAHGEEFVVSLLITHSMSWLFLIAACIIVPRSWQDKAASVTQLRARDRWLRWSLGDSAQRAAYRSRLLDVNAFYWLASRSRIKPALVWAVLGTMTCGWLWCWMKFERDWIAPENFIVTAILLNTVLKGWFAGEVCAQLAEDRRTGALELLISTPLDVKDVVRGQLLALGRQFLWPLIFAVGVELTFVFVGLRSNDVARGEMQWIFVWACGLVMLVTDLWAIFYVGLWQSLTARNANRANASAVVRIMALPWILFAMFTLVATVATNYGSQQVPGWIYILTWLLLGLAVNALFGFHARNKVRTQFRQAAMTRYTPPVSFWKRWFHVLGNPNGEG